jgi:putative transposase
MLVSTHHHDLLPMPGWRNTCVKPRASGQAPKYLIRDNDSKFGPCFARVAMTSGMEILKTPVYAPRAKAICERLMRSLRQECLDHLLIFQEKQHEPRAEARMWPPSIRHDPIKGLDNRSPLRLRSVPSAQDAGNKVIAIAVMGGLHHDSHWAA